LVVDGYCFAPIFSPSAAALANLVSNLTADPAVYGICEQSRHRADPVHFLTHCLVTTSNTKGVGHLQLIPEVGLGTQLA
jgi:hypothetical protein